MPVDSARSRDRGIATAFFMLAMSILSLLIYPDGLVALLRYL